MTGNKGEWSEFYTFVKLLADKKIFAADDGLEIIEELFYPLISIFREEAGSLYEYRISEQNNKILIFSGETEISVMDNNFSTKAKSIFDSIKSGTETFSIPLALEMMNELKVSTIKAGNNKKEDITLKIHDLNTGTKQVAGFSIKSMLGSPATLLNSSGATNFKYLLEGCSEEIAQLTNEIVTSSKVRDRISFLSQKGCSFHFKDTSSEVFSGNLVVLDSSLPLILSEYLLGYYFGKGSSFTELSTYLLENSAVLSHLQLTQVAHIHKIKSFLHAIALGMVPASPWDGEIRAHGGYIIVREDGELVCYHVFNADQFREYLYKNVKFDTPSTTRHNYGAVYEEDGSFYINLNIQVRFIR